MTTGPQTPSPPASSPAPPPRPRRLLRRILRDAAIIVLIVTAVLAIAILSRPSQAHLLYYQYRLSRLQLPADQVVYQFSPAAASALRPLPFFEESTALPAPTVAPQYDTTEGQDDNTELLPPHVIPFGGTGDPPAVDMFNRYMKYILTDGTQVLYAHALKLNGQTRLVIVQAGDNAHTLISHGFLEVIVLQPATFSALPRQLSRQRFPTANLHVPYAVTTFFAGQADPHNPAAFSLSFEQHGIRHSLAGTLLPDARHVSFQPAN